MYSDPPYSPGFGIPPPLLAGRDELVASTLAGLRGGPRHPAFARAFVGDRGVGKTVLLDAVARRVVDETGWPVVVHQALASEDLVAALLAKVPDEVGRVWSRWGRASRSLDKELRVGLNVGVVKAEAALRPQRVPSQPTDQLEKMFVRVGEFARDHRNGVLVSVDEAQVIRRSPDLEAFSRVMQVVTRRRNLPVAVLLAGLPDLPDRFLGAGTFLERLDVQPVGLLRPESVRYALVQPAADRGVRFADDALAQLVAESAGYPYLVQLLGFEAWTAAAGGAVIDGGHARTAMAAARKKLDGLLEPRWKQLSPLEQMYVKAMADHGPGPVPTRVITEALGRSARQLSSTRQELIDRRRLVKPAGWGAVEFTIPGFGRWLQARSVQHKRVTRRPPARSTRLNRRDVGL